MHFKYSVLAASMAATLSITGCGGDSDSSANESSKVVDKGGVVITAIDGYLTNAKVSVGEQCNILIGFTDEKGKIEISKEHENKKVCIEAIKDKTVDSTRGVVQKAFNLAAPAGYTIVSPITNLIAEQMMANKALSEAEAKQNVVNQFDGLNTSEELLFGDYLAKAEQDDTAKAINVIGEALVDNKTTIERQLELTEKLVDETNTIINDPNQEINDYSPVIDIPADATAPITVTPNSRPTITEDVQAIGQTIDFGEPIADIQASAFFKDAPSDTLSYSMDVMANDGKSSELNLHIDPASGVVSGLPDKAGQFTLYLYATDNYDARSYPVQVYLYVKTPNTAPAVNSKEQTAIQTSINQWSANAGKAIDESINIANLFSDADNDKLALTATTDSKGITVSIDNNQILWVKGTPVQEGSLKITVTASDGVNNQAAEAGFNLTIEKGHHPLENKMWFRLEHGSDDGDGDKNNDYQRIWCDSVLLKDGIAYGNDRSINNLTTCEAEEGNLTRNGTYKVQDNTINITLEDDPDGENYNEMSIASQADEISAGALIVNDWDERYTFFADKSDAEVRLNIQSDADAEQRDFKFELPGKEDGQYHFGSLSMSMTKNTGSDGIMDAEIWFGIPGEGITCETVREFYQSFELTGQDISTEHHNVSSMQLFDQHENGEDYCAVDIDIDQTLTIDNTYSLIGKLKESQKQYVEAVKFNIEWTGTGNND